MRVVRRSSWPPRCASSVTTWSQVKRLGPCEASLALCRVRRRSVMTGTSTSQAGRPVAMKTSRSASSHSTMSPRCAMPTRTERSKRRNSKRERSSNGTRKSIATRTDVSRRPSTNTSEDCSTKERISSSASSKVRRVTPRKRISAGSIPSSSPFVRRRSMSRACSSRLKTAAFCSA